MFAEELLDSAGSEANDDEAPDADDIVCGVANSDDKPLVPATQESSGSGGTTGSGREPGGEAPAEGDVDDEEEPA